METQSSKSPHPLVWAVAIALMVFCGAGFAALMGWIPTSLRTPDEAALTKLDTPSTGAARPATAKIHFAPTQAVAVAAKCAECGVIESVRAIDAKGEGSGIGAVGGAVVGGLLGNQVGGGNGKKIMTAVGAVGGAVAGNEVEKRVKTTRSYEITVRFDDGSRRVISEADTPAWHAGDKVMVIDGVIRPNA